MVVSDQGYGRNHDSRLIQPFENHTMLQQAVSKGAKHGYCPWQGGQLSNAAIESPQTVSCRP